jgi:AcrR family transcriptional regulator
MTRPRSGVVKTDKGQQTRAAILETALQMFRDRGYEQTRMRQEWHLVIHITISTPRNT